MELVQKDYTIIKIYTCNLLTVNSVVSKYLKFKSRKVSTVLGNIVVVSALTRCALFHSACDLKAAQISIQCRLIREFMLFELGHNTAVTSKYICCAKEKSAINQWTRNFARFARTTTIRQCQLDLKAWTPRLNPKT